MDTDTLRLAVFLAMLGGMALWEFAAPDRRAEIPRLIRWTNNLGILALDTALVRLLILNETVCALVTHDFPSTACPKRNYLHVFDDVRWRMQAAIA